MINKRGFTLAEVLIALGVLGIIAAFAVPKIMQSTAQAQRNALFKETFTVFQQVLYEGVLSGDIRTMSPYAYFSQRLNTVKVCTNDYVTEGCLPYNSVTGTTDPAPNSPGFVLSSGAVMIGFSKNICAVDSCISTMLIDIDGPNGPNLADADDVTIFDSMKLYYNYGKVDGFTAGAPVNLPGTGPKLLKPGVVLHPNEYINEERFMRAIVAP